ncbi:MAG: efflux RND transporter permease subunit [bacterium]|nr:efflux RND transporter permease subunit [bacterium]
MLRAIIGRPVSVLIATLALVVIGFFSLLRLPVSLLPTLERPRLLVTVRDADSSREELLERVVEPLERRFLSLAGVLEIHTTVDDGWCRLALESEWQTDVDRLRIDAERRLGEISSLDLDELEVTVEAGDRRPILEIAVVGAADAHARTVFADQVLIPELGRLSGAGRLRRLGGATRRPVVRPNAAALAARGLIAADLVTRLRHLGRSQPVGQLRDGGLVRPLLLREPVDSLAQLRAIRLEGEDGVTLGDVAEVRLEDLPDASRFTLAGEDAVLVEVHRAPGANAVLLARAARRRIDQLAARTAGTLRLEIVRDASREVVEALRQLGLAGLLGLLLGTLVLRWMLASWRPTLALSVVVPASLVAAFAGFYLWDVSLDIVSLAGLALAAGMLVDNSIVVLEAIEGARVRSQERPPPICPPPGEPAAADGGDPVVRGTRQIALALVASFLTTVVVFLPLIYLRGLARAFFGVQAFAIVTALAVSLGLSLSLTPVLARRLGRGSRSSGGRSPGRGLYLALLDFALAHPWLVVAVAVVVLAAGLGLLPSLPRELVPEGPARILAIDYRLPPGLSPEEAILRVTELERVVAGAGSSSAGSSSAGSSSAGSPAAFSLYRGRDEDQLRPGEETERGELELVFDDAASLARARESLRTALSRLPGVDAELRVRRSAVAAAVERSTRRLEIEVSATTPKRAGRLAERVVDFLRDAAGLTAEPVAAGRAQPAFVVDWDAFRLTELDADPEALTEQVRTGLGGFPAGRVDIAGIEPEILMEATRPSDPRLLPVRLAVPETETAVPRVLPLAAVAAIERRLQPPVVERRNGRPAVRLLVDTDGGRLHPARVAALLDEVPLAVDEGVRLVGQAHELRRSFAQLRLALILALVLVFLTVAALYESLTVPLVVMTTVPIAAAGALGMLWLSGQSLNVMSFLGLILLAGIVVNNAIVLVHRIEQRHVAGSAPLAAIREAASERYRPIVMTTLTTLLGMIPLAALGGEGIELRRALAVAVSGGLLSSLFAALVVVPVLYRVLVLRRTPVER